MGQRVDNQACFILHRRDFRNTSLILEVFSANYGRIAMVARGARRPKSPANALLQVFQPLLISWTGRGEMVTLTQVEAAEFVKPLSGTMYASAYYLTELIFRLLKHADVHETLFSLYATTLSSLRDAGPDSQVAERSLRVFEKYLLEELGYGLVLDHDVNSGDPIDPEREYQYIPEHGPVLQQGNTTLHGPTVKGSSLLALDSDALDNQDNLRDCKRLMRAVLQNHIGDKPLQSRMLYTS